MRFLNMRIEMWYLVRHRGVWGQKGKKKQVGTSECTQDDREEKEKPKKKKKVPHSAPVLHFIAFMG